MRVSAGAGLLLISAICAVLYKYETNTDIRDANGRQMYDQQTTTSKNTSLGPLYNPRHRWVFLRQEVRGGRLPLHANPALKTRPRAAALSAKI